MSPKEKAQELTDKMKSNLFSDGHYDAVQCALIAVKEIQNFGNQIGVREPLMYWNQVETELNKMLKDVK